MISNLRKFPLIKNLTICLLRFLVGLLHQSFSLDTICFDYRFQVLIARLKQLKKTKIILSNCMNGHSPKIPVQKIRIEQCH
jgi:hypothetical protein